LAPGDQVPFLGLEVTIPTAAALKATLDQCVATLRENKGYCEERLAQDRRASTETVKVVQFQATSREEVLRQALAASQKKELTQVEQVEKEKAGQILWVAVGAGVGLLVGAAVGAGATLYLQSHVTIQVP
jgi:late competence protein required for DNA uptake (superfamily II DNA/RNA helicase)